MKKIVSVLKHMFVNWYVCVCAAVAIPAVHWGKNGVFIATSSANLFHTGSLTTTYILSKHISIYKYFCLFRHLSTSLHLFFTCVMPTAQFQPLSLLLPLCCSSSSPPSNWCWHQINNFTFSVLLSVCGTLLTGRRGNYENWWSVPCF